MTILTHEGERTHFCRFEPIQLSNGDFGMTLSISMKSQIINIANHAGAITPNIPLTPSGGKARNSRRRSTLPGARRARPRACC